MAVMIRGTNLSVHGVSQNGGLFFGQNIQNDWDSTSPVKGATGFNMGDCSAVLGGLAYYGGTAYTWQSVADGDVKGVWNGRMMV